MKINRQSVLNIGTLNSDAVESPKKRMQQSQHGKSLLNIFVRVRVILYNTHYRRDYLIN